MKVIFYDTRPFEKEYLEEHTGAEFEKYYFSNSLNPDTFIQNDVKNAEIISCFINSKLTKNVLLKFPNLKFIILRSVGYSHVDIAYAKERGISVFYAPHYGDYSIAEYTFALLLAVSRKIIEANTDIKNQTIDDLKYQGIELYKKTIGIVGLGAIGKKVAEIAKSFSMNVLCYDINKESGYNYVTLDEMCQKSDVISINCALNYNTLHMFDLNRFKMMKNGVIIINTARGEVIKTMDLYQALLDKKVAYAGLDVVECEDIVYENNEINNTTQNCLKSFFVTNKLLNMKNVLITPHIAYNTEEAKKRILEITVENLIASTKFTTGAKNLVLI